jgi:serine/threonine protein phosphatase PrpC
MKQIEVRSAGISDTGLLRSENQDQFFVADLTLSMHVQSGSLGATSGSRFFGGTLGHLFFVADGMGGHRAGNEASMLAIQYFVNSVLNSSRWLVHLEQLNQTPFVEDLKNLLLNAHRTIQNQSDANLELKGMGTTLTMAYVVWPKMFVVHAGDTRCYIKTQNELRLITRDHTVANQMMESGQLEPNAVERSPWSNVLVNALGAGADEVFAEVHQLDLAAGDSILMCSDGLNKHVTDQQIHQVLLAESEPEIASRKLVELALQGGGSDNVTVVIAKFNEMAFRSPRMKTTAANPSETRVIQDVPFPEAELDTMVEFEDESGRSIDTDSHDTADFPEQGEHSGDGKRDTEEFYRPT